MRKLTVVLGCLLLAACGGGEEPARREVLQFNAGQPGMIVDGKPVSRELLAAVARVSVRVVLTTTTALP